MCIYLVALGDGRRDVTTTMVWQTELCNNFDRLRSESELYDTTVIGSDGQTLFAHSALLAASSQKLKTQLVAHLQEGAPLSVHVDGISGHIWNFVLQFIYSGKTQPTNIHEAEGIMQAGETLDIEALADIGRKFMEDNKLELDYTGNPVTSYVVPTHAQDTPHCPSPSCRSLLQANLSNQSNQLQSNQSNVAIVGSDGCCMGYFVPAETEPMNEVNYVSSFSPSKITVSTQTYRKKPCRVKKSKTKTCAVRKGRRSTSCSARRQGLRRRQRKQGRRRKLGLSRVSSTQTLVINNSATQTRVSSAHDVRNSYHKPDGVWVCKICGITITEYSLLGPHMTTHAIEAPWDSPDYVTFIPGVPVVDGPVVVGRLDESDAETYIDGECPQCHRIQRRSVQLPRQLYACPLCGQAYRNRRLLRKHMSIHAKA